MVKQVPSMLKAEDALYFAVFNNLGLNVYLQAMWDMEAAVYAAKYDDNYGYKINNDDDHDDSDGGCDVADDGLRFSELTSSGNEHGADLLRQLERRTDIMWLTKDFKYKEQATNSEYTGNEGCEMWYSAAVVLADVPAWGSKARNKLVQSVKASNPSMQRSQRSKQQRKSG